MTIAPETGSSSCPAQARLRILFLTFSDAMSSFLENTTEVSLHEPGPGVGYREFPCHACILCLLVTRICMEDMEWFRRGRAPGIRPSALTGDYPCCVNPMRSGACEAGLMR